eukprot:scaffold310_cov302-Prasinococcus_capsulatus_cf.AAC.13
MAAVALRGRTRGDGGCGRGSVCGRPASLEQHSQLRAPGNPRAPPCTARPDGRLGGSSGRAVRPSVRPWRAGGAGVHAASLAGVTIRRAGGGEPEGTRRGRAMRRGPAPAQHRVAAAPRPRLAAAAVERGGGGGALVGVQATPMMPPGRRGGICMPCAARLLLLLLLLLQGRGRRGRGRGRGGK